MITIWVAMSMYCGFSHSTLACYAVTSWPPCHSTWVHVTVYGLPVTIHGPMSLACYAHVKYMYCDMGHMTCDMSPCDMGEIYFDSVCTMILCMYCDSMPISACHSRCTMTWAMYCNMGAMYCDMGAMYSDRRALYCDMGAMHYDMGAMYCEKRAMYCDMGAMHYALGAMHYDMGAMHYDMGAM